MNYEDKLRLAKEALASNSYDKETIEYIFPELQESDDERIKKAIVKIISDIDGGFSFEKYSIIKKEALAWLEKQGEQENLCDKCRKEQPSHSCQDITALGRCALEKQGEQKPVECIKFDNEFENQISHLIASVLNGEHEYNEGFVKYASQSLLGFAKKEQKPADKVEHGFKVGDWITTVNDVGVRVVENVVEFTGSNVRLVDTYGAYTLCPQSWLNNYYFWTIQDAKDGDVLIDGTTNTIGIFKEINKTHWYSKVYCGNVTWGSIFSNGGLHKIEATKPATKEQCDLLFKKMKESGYKWDAEKKELKVLLKKSEPKKVSVASFAEMDSIVWSEEDENMWLQIINELEAIKSNSSTIFEKNIAQDKIDWLKSLKPQPHWKPSEKQMEELARITRGNSYPHLSSLYNELKKL